MDLRRLIKEARDQEDRETLAGLSFEQRSCLVMGHLVIMLDILMDDLKAERVNMTDADHYFAKFAISTITKSWGSFDDFANALDDYVQQNPNLLDSIARMRNTAIHFNRKTDDS